MPARSAISQSMPSLDKLAVEKLDGETIAERAGPELRKGGRSSVARAAKRSCGAGLDPWQCPSKGKPPAAQNRGLDLFVVVPSADTTKGINDL
jgi:hypothetical protein